jgi:apolipoprotein N-acyltransferase
VRTAALFAALGAWLGFANPLLHLPLLVLLFPGALAWIGLNAGTPRLAFRWGWVAGLASYAGSLYWISLPIHDYGPLPWILAVPCPVLLAAVIALYPAVFSWGLRKFGRDLPWPLLALFAAGLWGGLEHLRGVAFTGFPWLVLPSALSPWPFAVQGASVVGANGLAGLLAAAATLALRGRGLSPPRLAAAGLLGLLALYGVWRVDTPAQAVGEARVALIQGNVDQAHKWDPAWQAETLRRYTELSAQEAKAGADLLVWPETAMPFFFQDPTPLSLAVRDRVKEMGVGLLAGSPAYTRNLGSRDYVLHNRAVLTDGSGITLGHYDKEHLVPFGEYVPLSGLLGFLPKLVQGIGEFAPGQDQPALNLGNLALGVLICYETIFPELAQDRVEHGANLLVNISNDAWFGRSSAPLQHLHLSVLRAVEQNRWIARDTNTGITALIDPRGRIVDRTGLFETTALAGRVELITQTTPFHRWRTWVEAGLALAALLPLVLPRFRRRR